MTDSTLAVACPPWCDTQGLHTFDRFANGTKIRWHCQSVAEVGDGFSVGVTAEESVPGSGLSTTSMYVDLTHDDGAHRLSAKDAEAIGVALVLAARRLRKIEAGQ
jgi:hypothetical protein